MSRSVATQNTPNSLPMPSMALQSMLWRLSSWAPHATSGSETCDTPSSFNVSVDLPSFPKKHLAHMSCCVATRMKRERVDTKSEGTRVAATFCENLGHYLWEPWALSVRTSVVPLCQLRRGASWCCALRVSSGHNSVSCQTPAGRRVRCQPSDDWQVVFRIHQQLKSDAR